jgi:hypothetical protein
MNLFPAHPPRITFSDAEALVRCHGISACWDVLAPQTAEELAQSQVRTYPTYGNKDSLVWQRCLEELMVRGFA